MSVELVTEDGEKVETKTIFPSYKGKPVVRRGELIFYENGIITEQLEIPKDHDILFVPAKYPWGEEP